MKWDAKVPNPCLIPAAIRETLAANLRRKPRDVSRMIDPHFPPGKDAIAGMTPFIGLTLDQIEVITTLAQADAAVEALMNAGFVGFDTESKPTFQKGQQSEGPHVLQFSTLERAYVFQSHVAETVPAILSLLKSPALTKIGFGLKGDFTQIASRFGLRPASVVDLETNFRRLGYHHAVGAKTAVAILFQRRFPKSKSVTMSNWSVPKLTDQQLLYAANDAYAAIRVHHALQAL